MEGVVDVAERNGFEVERVAIGQGNADHQERSIAEPIAHLGRLAALDLGQQQRVHVGVGEPQRVGREPRVGPQSEGGNRLQRCGEGQQDRGRVDVFDVQLSANGGGVARSDANTGSLTRVDQVVAGDGVGDAGQDSADEQRAHHERENDARP